MSSLFADLSNRHYALILAGGSGTRLWPMSRADRPKHLLSLGGTSLLQQSVSRILRLELSEHSPKLLVITRQNQTEETREQLETAAANARWQLLSEPSGRNTLPAIAWAAFLIAQSGQDALISVFPSDHHIGDTPAFLQCWKAAIAAAENGYLVTFGIEPDKPETGFGYIQAGRELFPGVLAASGFVEKPDEAKAREYLASREYYWNSGMFVFRVSAFLEELSLHQPTLEKALRGFKDLNRPTAEEYESLASISIDHGLMEKSERVAVVPAKIEWSDLGSWDAIHGLLEKDDSGNAVQGEVLTDNTTNSLLFSSSGLLATIGIDNLAVIQTPDAVLVTPLNQSQRVKEIANRAEQLIRKSANLELTERPWGTYQVLEEGPSYKIKRIVVDPGQKLSLQRHAHRAEHWVVIEGTATVTCGDKVLIMRANESTYIPQGEKHRLENLGTVPLVIIEVQTGSYVGEDDIERFEDIYGRTRS